MLRNLMIVATASAALCASAFAQAQLDTAAKAKAMLEKAIAAVKADKAKAIETINKGEGGFKDGDLYPFCFNISDSKFIASAGQPQLVGTDVRALKEKSGKALGEEILKAALEGKVSEVSYMFPRPGQTEPVQKVSFVAKAGDVGCAVGYYK